MRFFLTAVILTLLAQPVGAYPKEDCRSFKTKSYDWLHAADSTLTLKTATFFGRQYHELNAREKARFDELGDKYRSHLLNASAFASIYAAFCKE